MSVIAVKDTICLCTYTAMYVLEATNMLCIPTVKSNMYHETQQGLKYICDWICKKRSYTRNYEYLEIPF